MKRYLRLYWLFLKYSLIRALTYKQEFVTWSFVNIGWLILNLVFYELLFLNVSQIAGWQKANVLVLLGMYFLFEFILWGVLWPNLREIPRKINTGRLDLELTKPINTQFLLSFKTIDIHIINSLILGIVTIAYGLKLTGLPSLPNVILSLTALVLASIYVYSGWFITICAAFWFDRIYNLPLLFPELRQFWRVPQPFYQGPLRFILTFVIPVTLVTTVPTQLLIHQENLTLYIVLAAFAALSLAVSSRLFAIALTRYSGASS